MGTTKKIGFKEDINDLAIVFKALGHPARIQIMNTLLIKDNCTCGDIVSALPLAQSTVSKHLLELKKANLLHVTNSGKKTIYTVELDQLHILNFFIKNYISNVDNNKVVIESEKIVSVKTTPNINDQNRKSNLKQLNYQFPDKKKDEETI